MKQLFLFFIVLYLGLFFDNMNIFRLCILSSLLHEAGHIIAYRLCYKKWPQIDVSVFGLKMKNNVVLNKNTIFILLSGPVINLMAVVFSLIYSNIRYTFGICIFAIINFFIFMFNTLPVYYLDGGQILYCLWPFYQRNYRYISIFTITLIYVMVIYFTGFNVYSALAIVYFIVNILNDI